MGEGSAHSILDEVKEMQREKCYLLVNLLEIVLPLPWAVLKAYIHVYITMQVIAQM